MRQDQMSLQFIHTPKWSSMSLTPRTSPSDTIRISSRLIRKMEHHAPLAVVALGSRQSWSRRRIRKWKEAGLSRWKRSQLFVPSDLDFKPEIPFAELATGGQHHDIRDSCVFWTEFREIQDCSGEVPFQGVKESFPVCNSLF